MTTLGVAAERYAFGSNVYPYNSVNAFNLVGAARHAVAPDNQYICGYRSTSGASLLVLAALALIVWRYLR